MLLQHTFLSSTEQKKSLAGTAERKTCVHILDSFFCISYPFISYSPPSSIFDLDVGEGESPTHSMNGALRKVVAAELQYAQDRPLNRLGELVPLVG